MQPMIGSPQQRPDLETSSGKDAINALANSVPVLKETDQTLSFSVTGPNGQSMSCQASYSETLGNATPQGQIILPINDQGSNLGYTTTQPTVTQTH